MKILLITLLLAFGTQSWAKSVTETYSVKNYEEAEKSPNYIRFDMESTKAGIFTTSFTGLVKQFSVHLNLTKNGAQNINISFNTVQMDTDNGSRNEKMHDYCLEKDKYPTINVRILDPITFNQKKVVNAILNIRGKDKPIKLMTDNTVVDGKATVKGSTVVKLSELEIPDPSILVASVDDKVVLRYNVSFELDGSK